MQEGLDGQLVSIDQEGQWAIGHEGPPEAHTSILRCLRDRQHMRVGDTEATLAISRMDEGENGRCEAS